MTESSPSIPPPRLIAARYHLEVRLGEGAHAVTWRAWDERLGRTVTLKLLRPELAIDPVFQARFAREARAAAAISAPRVVAVFDHGTDAGTPYIVYQYVQGRSLAELVREGGPPPIGDAVDLALDILQGLAALHAAGIVHRDVKPANILVGDDGRAALTDLGISLVPGDASLTTAGVTVGTAAYMAPEQARGEAVGPPADLYALGVVLYELLTGRRPFTSPQALAVMLEHLHTPPPPLRLVAPARGIPPALEAVVLRSLAKDPADRFPTAAQMAVALEAAMTGQGHFDAPTAALPAPAAAPRSPRTDRRHAGRRWRGAGLLATALLALLILGGAALMRIAGQGGLPPTATPPVTVAPSPSATSAVTVPARAAPAPPTPTVTATATLPPSPTATATATATASATATVSATATATLAPTATMAPTAAATPSPPATAVPSPTETAVPVVLFETPESGNPFAPAAAPTIAPVGASAAGAAMTARAPRG